uniref:Inner membrane protein n=1 Tax=Strongyloides venezuelensis TaxID=75913 RepID=A0A0K0G5R3_STRVS
MFNLLSLKFQKKLRFFIFICNCFGLIFLIWSLWITYVYDVERKNLALGCSFVALIIFMTTFNVIALLYKITTDFIGNLIALVLFSTIIIFLNLEHILILPKEKTSTLLNYYFSLLKTTDKIKAKEIAVVVVSLDDKLDGYIHAIRTMRCYCFYYGYTYVILNELTNQDLAKNCKQNDFMFRRYYVGVVNLLKKIENYLPRDNEEVLLYDRFYNDEIAAGSYIIKNNNYSRKFLNYFANYSFRVPRTNYGTDNIAL